jgi:zinc/manganese transport system substrate-binding protein
LQFSENEKLEMKNKKEPILFFAVLFFFVSVTSFAAPLRVVASTTDLAAIAREIGGDRIIVQSLCRADQDPHEFEILLSQATVVQQADVCLKVGLALDVWADKLLATTAFSHTIIVDCSQGVAVIGGEAGKDSPHPLGNPHYWLGPTNLPLIAANIRDALMRADSAHAAEFQEHYDTFAARADSAFQMWKEKLSACRSVGLVSTHSSWDYFARDFGLTIIGVVHRIPDVEPSPADFAHLEDLIRRHGHAVFLKEPFVPERIPTVLARDTGLHMLMAPSSVGTNGAQDVWSFFDHLVRDLSAACKEIH